jgi:hypothetical protein
VEVEVGNTDEIRRLLLEPISIERLKSGEPAGDS